MGTVAAGEGFPVAILNHNEPAFYCIPAKIKLRGVGYRRVYEVRDGEVVVLVVASAMPSIIAVMKR
ncbi:type II toxin-antitoxin system Phd/YefM family antitoxin [Burkholderia metallica]|uniref:type II toxin-antitoxin system Phd/YefM family antitoxin n=1 Tax=Burkholderia metallica TaxID=488729 RepID=UPI001454B050|nr:type II toxin-antitoxin system Phd/YefM family antitoxin [Burkholderia metallica]VWB47914.1 prevent-host-death family protein [Burkholderia metallica]